MLGSLFLALFVAQAPASPSSDTGLALLARYCTECRGGRRSRAGLDLALATRPLVRGLELRGA